MLHRLPITSHDELGDLAAALNVMAADLKTTLERLETESRRSRTIMESMGDGLLVLDARGKVSPRQSRGRTASGHRTECRAGP